MIFLYQEFAKQRSSIMTQEKLADISGINVSTIKQIESGRRKSFDDSLVVPLCTALNLDPYQYVIRETKVIAVLSNKGGSSKTTTTANLAFSLAKRYNRKVLIIDTDMQQNLTQHYGLQIEEEDDEDDENSEYNLYNFYNAFSKNESLLKHKRTVIYDEVSIDIVTSHDAMSMMETEMAGMDLREYRFKNIVKEAKDSGYYDYILVDCNPSLNLLNKSILYGSDFLIIPLVANAFGLRGIQYVMRYKDSICHNHPDLKTLGILVNNFDRRTRISKDIYQFLTKAFGNETNKLFKTIIPTDTCVSQSQLLCEPVGVAFHKSRANRAYDDLACEVIKRIQDYAQ